MANDNVVTQMGLHGRKNNETAISLHPLGLTHYALQLALDLLVGRLGLPNGATEESDFAYL